ncbi:MAG: hypothetical protein IKF82_08035 [Bacilli bacterium]|nr:hypothetical protein [Bacilli bacterium]
MWLIIIFVLIILFCLGLMFYLLSKKNKDKQSKSGFSVKTTMPQTIKPKPATEEIEILDVFADDKELKDDDGSPNLDDLFKTISMTAINDENFDFGLRRSNK